MIDLSTLTKVNRQTKSYYKPASEKQIEVAKELGHEEPEKETVHTLSLWIDKAIAAQKEKLTPVGCGQSSAGPSVIFPAASRLSSLDSPLPFCHATG